MSKITIDQYSILAPAIAASLTVAYYTALSHKKPDETNHQVLDQVMDIWAQLTSMIESTPDLLQKKDGPG